jgi:cell division protein FtsW (lipid II flippase)
MLSFIPFFHPLAAAQQWWYVLLVPLAFGISVVYKAVRMRTLDGYWKQVAMMTAQVVFAMVGLAVCLVILVQVIIPRLPVD